MKPLDFARMGFLTLVFWMCWVLVSCDYFDSDTENAPPEIQSVNGEDIQVSPKNPTPNQWVTLEVNAVDPDEDELRFFWSVKFMEEGKELPTVEPINKDLVSKTVRLPQVQFRPPEEGTYQVVVNVVDVKGAMATATTTFTVSKTAETQPPLEFREPAIISGKQTIFVSERVLLVANPLELNSKLKYDWSAGGEGASISHTESPSDDRRYFQSGKEGEFTITITMSDDSGREPVEGAIVITVTKRNSPPLFDAQPFSLKPEHRFFLIDETIEITANATDEDKEDMLKYEWQVFLDGNEQDVAGEVLRRDLSSENKVFFKAGTAGFYIIETTISDGRGGKDKTFLKLNVNTPPVFQQGITINGVLSVGSDIELTASAKDPDNDELSYSWEAKLENEDKTNEVFGGKKTGNTVVFNTPKAGTYQITVTAEDGKRGIANNTVFINIKEP